MTKTFTAELFGTFILVLFGCGAAVIAGADGTTGIGLTGIALAFGLSIVAAAYGLGAISGAHLNPAVGAVDVAEDRGIVVAVAAGEAVAVVGLAGVHDGVGGDAELAGDEVRDEQQQLVAIGGRGVGEQLDEEGDGRGGRRVAGALVEDVAVELPVGVLADLTIGVGERTHKSGMSAAAP